MSNTHVTETSNNNPFRLRFYRSKALEKNHNIDANTNNNNNHNRLRTLKVRKQAVPLCHTKVTPLPIAPPTVDKSDSKNNTIVYSNNCKNGSLPIHRFIESSPTQSRLTSFHQNNNYGDNGDSDDDDDDCDMLEPNEQMRRFQKQALESIRRAYNMDTCTRTVSSRGSLRTSLPEDIMLFLQNFLIVLDICFLQKHSSPMSNREESTNDVSSHHGSDRKSKLARWVSRFRNPKVVPQDEQQHNRQKQHQLQNSFEDEDDILDMNSYFVDGMLYVIRTIHETHCSSRSMFLCNTTNTIEDLCAAANDFFRLSEKIDHFVTVSLLQKFPFLTTETNNRATPMDSMECEDEDSLHMSSSHRLIKECYELSKILLQDAVYITERCQCYYVIESITNNTTLSDEFFTLKWENDYTNNEVTQALVDVFDRHLSSIQRYLSNTYLYNKALIACSKVMVSFYIRCLLLKADNLGRCNMNRLHDHSLGFWGTERKPFSHPERALLRMAGDISIMSTYFRTMVEKNQEDVQDCTSDALIRMLANEMWILEVIHEYIQTASSSCCMLDGFDGHHTATSPNLLSSLENLIVVLHKRTGGDIVVTRYLVSDLWLLSQGPMNQRSLILQTVDQLEPDLKLVTCHLQDDQSQQLVSTQQNHSNSIANNRIHEICWYCTVDEMLQALYKERFSRGFGPLCWTNLYAPKGHILFNNSVKDGSCTNQSDSFVRTTLTNIDTMVGQSIRSITNNITTIFTHRNDDGTVMKKKKKKKNKQKIPTKTNKSKSNKFNKSSLKKFLKSNQGTKSIEAILSKLLL